MYCASCFAHVSNNRTECPFCNYSFKNGILIVDADDIQTPKQYLKNRRRVTKTWQRSINIFQGRSHQLTLAKADQKTIVKPSQIQKSTTAKPSESVEELIEQN